MRIGLYSISYLGVWYRGPALSVEDVIERARRFGYEGVEIDGKRPHGNPVDMPPARCADLRRRAQDAGVEIYAVAANNDFASPIPEHRESQLLYVRELIRMTPVTNSPDDMLRMIADVGSPHLKACLDAPLAAKQGIASMRETARSVRGLQVLSHFGGEYERSPDGSVLGQVRHPDDSLTPEDYYAEFAEGMRDIGYAGFTGYELCHPLPPIDGAPAGLDFADRNAELAAEYMRSLDCRLQIAD